MKEKSNYIAPARRSMGKISIILFVCLGVLIFGLSGCGIPEVSPQNSVTTVPTEPEAPETTQPTETTAPTEPEVTEPVHHWEQGFLAAPGLNVEIFDEEGNSLGTLTRGAPVEYEKLPDGRMQIQVEGGIGYLPEDADVVDQVADTIPAHTLYVRTAVNLRDTDGNLLETLADKGAALTVTGCDALL